MSSLKVGKFHFPADFVIVDYDVDPRVPLILGRTFLRMARALIDVHDEELILRVNDEALTFKTFLRTSDEVSNLDDDYYDTEGDILYLEKFLNEDPSQNLPPMKNKDLKQVDVTMTKPSIEEPPELETFLRTSDEVSNLDDDYYDTEGDILYLEKFLNEDPSQNLPPMKNKDLKQVDVTMTKPSIEEPPELEVKDLPHNLEYAF
nr:DNA-directed DNA polymerase [Tanacetum cinerariifolium]